jgi:hypothetical protein
MSENAEVPAREVPAREVPARKSSNWAAKVIVVLVLVAVAVISYFVLAAVLPLWWANTIKDQVGGNLGSGILVGMFYGFVFTFVPLLVAWQATHRRVSWPLKIAILLVAVALATPNLLTLAVMNGTTESSHNAQRIIGTDATWFPMWSGISAIAAGVVFVIALVLWTAWRRRGRKMKELRRHNELARMAAEDAEREHAEQLKEAERQNIIARRVASSEHERRVAAESATGPTPQAEPRDPADSEAPADGDSGARHRRPDDGRRSDDGRRPDDGQAGPLHA